MIAPVKEGQRVRQPEELSTGRARIRTGYPAQRAVIEGLRPPSLRQGY